MLIEEFYVDNSLINDYNYSLLKYVLRNNPNSALMEYF